MKKGLKKVLSLLLAITILTATLPLSVSAETPTSGKCGDNVTWNFDRSTGTLTINGKGAMNDFDYWHRPPWNDGEFKTDTAFGSEIKTVIIGDGVTNIGEFAFSHCEALTSVTYPESVTSIGVSAFSYCNNLSEIYISKSITSISVYVGSLIGGSTPFEGCNNLKSITVDPANTSFASVDGVLYNKDKTVLIAYPGGKGSNYNIPNGVKEIGPVAFAGCSNLTSITIPNTVTRIRTLAFYNSGITSLTIPSSITHLDDPDVFAGCSSLRTIKLPKTVVSLGESDIDSDLYWEGSLIALPGDGYYRGLSNYGLQEIFVDSDNPVYASVDGVLYNKSKTRLLYFPAAEKTDYTIPSGVTSIAPEVFSGYPNLRSVTIPKTVTRISDCAFVFMSDEFISDDFIIYGIKGSYAETYAKNNDINFVAVTSTDKPPEPLPTQFTDVPAGAYYVDAVKWAVENDITAGTSATTFSPNASCTRAQAVTFLWRAAGSPKVEGTTGFSDVADSAYYADAVKWAVANGITQGTGNGKFSPNATCNRAQIVTFMYRAEGSPAVSGNNSFGDVDSDDYYNNAVRWAVQNGITEGTGNGKFSPNSNCTRAQIVTFLYRGAK